MQWIKKGLIFRPTYGFDWMHAYAWVPTVEQMEADLFKVYFASRNVDNMSQTGYFTFNINKPTEILTVSEEPIIKLGPLGSFDDSLAVACTLVEHRGAKYLYYVGWMQGKRVRYYPSIGLAISTDGGKNFQKFSRAPLLDRTDDDPFGMASPFVMLDNGVWRMWYASYRRWDLRNGDPWPHYELRYAESKDGIQWERNGIVCIGSDTEEAVARPYIVKERNLYCMWYCYRIQFGNYRIGYAESSDGINWVRKDDQVGIDVSPSGWDSEMIEYPCIFNHKGKKYMLYNGNTFGFDGIGLAIAEE